MSYDVQEDGSGRGTEVHAAASAETPGLGPVPVSAQTVDGGCSAPRPEPALTLDEARIQVGRMMCKIATSFITETEATVATSEVDAANQKLLVAAAKEFHDSVLLLVKKLERPRILQPSRRVRLVR